VAYEVSGKSSLTTGRKPVGVWAALLPLILRGDGKRYVVRVDEKLTAFVELERAIYEFALNAMS
jgi:hypothetical protein